MSRLTRGHSCPPAKSRISAGRWCSSGPRFCSGSCSLEFFVRRASISRLRPAVGDMSPAWWFASSPSFPTGRVWRFLHVALLASSHSLAAPESPSVSPVAKRGLGGLAGQVLEKRSQLPLPGVTVVVHEAVVQGVTNEKGRFRLQSLAPGSYSVEFRLWGYVPLVKTSVIVRAEPRFPRPPFPCRTHRSTRRTLRPPLEENHSGLGHGTGHGSDFRRRPGASSPGTRRRLRLRTFAGSAAPRPTPGSQLPGGCGSKPCQGTGDGVPGPPSGNARRDPSSHANVTLRVTQT